MWHELTIGWTGAGLVVISTVVMYLAFVLLLRVVGQRALTAMASTDLALVVAAGAVIGRTTLLETPTLGAGLVALLTLFVLQTLFVVLRKRPRLHDRLSPRPLLLVGPSGIVATNLRRARMVESDLHQRLRMIGIASLDDVACVILERNGAISIVRSGARIDAAFMQEVDAG